MRTSSAMPDTDLRAGGFPGPRSLSACLALVTAVAACDVAWGGARVSLEHPVPEREKAPEEPVPEEARRSLPPVPSPPLLHVVRLGADGRALSVPVARVTPAGLADLGWPDDPPESWVASFGALHLSSGSELPLLAGGRRAGSLLLEEVRPPARPGCPPPVTGRVLLPPGAPLPEAAFAVSPELATGLPEPTAAGTLTRQHRVFAPILAERLLEEAGVGRAFLARRAALRPVVLPGDTAAGMAATYLIRDTLAAVPPPGDASISLHFLARYDPARGFVPVWSHVTRYGDAAGKEILAHLGWITLPPGPFELLRRVTADAVGLAAARLPATVAWAGLEPGVPGGARSASPEGSPPSAGDLRAGEVVWREAPGCPALEALSGLAAGSAP